MDLAQAVNQPLAVVLIMVVVFIFIWKLFNPMVDIFRDVSVNLQAQTKTLSALIEKMEGNEKAAHLRHEHAVSEIRGSREKQLLNGHLKSFE